MFTARPEDLSPQDRGTVAVPTVPLWGGGCGERFIMCREAAGSKTEVGARERDTRQV